MTKVKIYRVDNKRVDTNELEYHYIDFVIEFMHTKELRTVRLYKSKLEWISKFKPKLDNLYEKYDYTFNDEFLIEFLKLFRYFEVRELTQSEKKVKNSEVYKIIDIYENFGSV